MRLKSLKIIQQHSLDVFFIWSFSRVSEHCRQSTNFGLFYSNGIDHGLATPNEVFNLSRGAFGTFDMLIERVAIADVLLLVATKRCDPRGFFSEVYRRDVLAVEGVQVEFVQDNHVFSAERGILRGLHFQTPPKAQGKLVRCTQGAILDVAVDIRKGSPTYGHHIAVELSAANWKQLWVPPGFAHGYLTLEAPCEVIYKVTEYWAPDCERGIAWDDPELAIEWGIPVADVVMADKDRSNPCLTEIEPVFYYDRRNS